MKKIILILILSISVHKVTGQKWIVKDSILVFPDGFASWLKRNNGGIDLANPGQGNSMGSLNSIGTNQGVDVFDFNKDGLSDLIFQFFPTNNATREYVRGIFIQNSIGKYVLDTNYVIKGKGDMWNGLFGDFNGDGLNDYMYITQNYHGADSNRKYNTEMIGDNWPDRVFINNGKSFDTLSLDVNNLQVLTSYAADIDNDGSDEIICAGRDPFLMIYKYDKKTKIFYRINTELNTKWNSLFNMRTSDYPLFNMVGTNDKNGFSTILRNNCQVGGNSPYCYTDFTLVSYKFFDNSITQTKLNRDEWFIPMKYSLADADDYYKFNLHENPSVYKIDIDNNGEDEIVTGSFYMNDYSKGKQRYADGWKVLSLNGKDVTTQFFQDSAFDRNVDLTSHGLDIDENTNGIEMIPGTWGADGDGLKYIGTVGYYYRIVNKKFEKYFIRDIKHESGRKLDSTYFKTMQLTKYPNFTKSKNALLMYDFQDIKRTSIIYQASCTDATKPIFEKSKYFLCGDDSVSIKINNFSKNDSTAWFKNNKLFTTNIQQIIFKSTDTIYVTKIDTNGCSKTSDVLLIDKYPKPSTPILSRDSENNLVASINSITWYKEGVKIADTTQKIKPNINGIYTATTTQNGCTSSISQGYYYITNAVSNLSNGEYFKVSPNPTSGELNINYRFSNNKDVYISVININGRNVILNKKINSGSKINLGSFSKGNYIIQINDKTGRLITSQKLVKE
jgi:hypothetical protein